MVHYGWKVLVDDEVILKDNGRFDGSPYAVSAAQKAKRQEVDRRKVKADRRPPNQRMYRDPIRDLVKR